MAITREFQSRQTRRLLWRAASLVVASGLALAPAAAAAKQNAFRETPHGDRVKGVLRVRGARPGACVNCHGAPKQGAAARAGGGGHMSLYLPNDNGLCADCHAITTRSARSWLGPQRYEESAHARARAMVWPGPGGGRRTADAGKCVNCHDPHGDRDQLGVIPSLLRARGTALCLTCHRGSPGADVASALTRTFRHPLTIDPVASAAGARSPAMADETCSACHNPHTAGISRGSAAGNPSSTALAGVARVRLQAGASGAAPTAIAVPADDTTAVQEFEVCFRCHALAPGGTRRPAADVATKLGPAASSFHPVTGRARGMSADPRTFVSPWGAGRMVTCSDCHSSDGGQIRGPHGSAYRHLLKKPYEASSAQRQPAPGDLCFDCHQYGTYGPGASTAASVSRFPRHGAHAALGVGCWSCHDAHGSADLPSLLVLRSPGLVSYGRDAGGGSCATSCHVKTPATGRYAARAARPR